MMRKTPRLAAGLCLAMLLMVLCGCAKKDAQTPVDPCRAVLELAAEADRVVLAYSRDHMGTPSYRELLDPETIRALAGEIIARMGEMAIYDGGHQPLTKVIFYQNGAVLAECGMADMDAGGAPYLGVIAGVCAQWYQFPGCEEFLVDYWEAAREIDESEVAP